MYRIGDEVIYGIHGVCAIRDVETRTVDKKKIQYFVLEPINSAADRFYVPAENPAALAKLRHIISRPELDALLTSDEIRQNCWIVDENHRKQRYRELISSADRCALLQMIHTLHIHKREQVEAGRKFHLCDENFLRDAERLLNSEFSLVLEIEPDSVGPYIRSLWEK